jgi:hypothetical protein
LLSGSRAALHLKIAEEIERRAGNRLPEVVEKLAHHFGQTDCADKAFKYLAMAGTKSNGVFIRSMRRKGTSPTLSPS